MILSRTGFLTQRSTLLHYDSDNVSAWKIHVASLGYGRVFGTYSRIGLQTQADHGPT